VLTNTLEGIKIMVPDVTTNIVLSFLFGFSGFCIFLAWPLRTRWVVVRYAHYLYHRWSFYCQCLLSPWPLVQAILFLFFKENATRITIIEYMLGCFVIQLLLLASDMFAINKMIFYAAASLEDVAITRQMYPIFRFFLVLAPAINVFLIIQLLGRIPPWGQNARWWVFAILFVGGCILNVLLLLFEKRLVQRVRKRLEVASA
jgi:hypothetical protein